ncbi:hypothetical protein [Actinosynnema mirum]|uniref:Uncharacterized protein n=1 Tax=Actinosynnema mirum (strain ATCC 29888 / DSM 43827 / JCM 3225 / NBRC 14064 / NCIMB 13271 / NRRL B-12336 / IMRU 3971 / 101) TaxID=446462 RepID=C6WBK1_ACTMD|nr:hypothetical protein [Actinosynnema mirum]ACU35569.1 hypothetical protein Amir_1620 [Actinosynnema mirum DSM 43827]
MSDVQVQLTNETFTAAIAGMTPVIHEALLAAARRDWPASQLGYVAPEVWDEHVRQVAIAALGSALPAVQRQWLPGTPIPGETAQADEEGEL